MGDFEPISGDELRLRDIEAVAMMQGCEIRVHRTMLASLLKNAGAKAHGKSLNDYFWEQLRKEREGLLAALSDEDPDRASWFAKYIRERMREDEK